MLLLSQSLLGRPVMSLRSGGKVATVVAAIVNPNNLKIEGFYCQDAGRRKDKLVLLTQDIRDIVPQGIAVNDHEVLVPPSDLVRLKRVIDMQFELVGKPVVTVSKERLGKISDYAVEIETMYIQKFYVAQSVIKSFAGGSLSVDRSQIVEITNRRIVIQDPLQPTKVAAGELAAA